MTQLALDLPNAISNAISAWIPELTKGLLNDGDSLLFSNNNNGDNNTNSPSPTSKLFDNLTPPTNVQEKNLLLALQDTFEKLVQKQKSLKDL